MAKLLRAIAIRHVAFENLGLLLPILKALGWAVSYRDAAIDDLNDHAVANADLLVVLGGPMSAYETSSFHFLTDELRILEQRLREDRATLGICLGSQLMAGALGARVFRGARMEIGWSRVALTDAGSASALKPLVAANASVLHWHGDTFDLPNGAVHLARSGMYEHQAFMYGKQALALQFHVEADPDTLEHWYSGHAVELKRAGVSVAELRSQTQKIAAIARFQAQDVFGHWLRSLDLSSSQTDFGHAAKLTEISATQPKSRLG